MKSLMKVPVVILCITVLYGLTATEAQQITIKGQVIDAATHEVVRFAHVENFSQGQTTFTDTSGIFNLEGREGDTLIFSAIGFFYKKVVVTDSLMSLPSIPVFQIDERVYDLAGATIYTPGTYQQFKHDVISLDIPETETDRLRKNLAIISRNVGKEAYDEAVAKGELDTGLIPILKIRTADEKARIRLENVRKQEERKKLIYTKYNADIVKKITGLTDDDEVISFMLFCDFKDEYLMEVNPLDLLEEIAKKFEEYKRKNAS